MDLEARLAELLGTLTNEYKVRVCSGPASEIDAALQVHAVAKVAQERWPPDPRDVETATVEQIAGSLEIIEADLATEILADLASYDLAHSVLLGPDPAQARRTATQVVDLLGPNATWWTNTSYPDKSWTPVTRHTFDGVVAGIGNSHFVVLLQVSED